MLKQLEPKMVTLCDTEFAIYPFGAMKAANLSGELIKFFGPIVSGVVPLVLGSDDVMNMDLKNAMPLVMGAFSVMDGDTVEKLLNKLLLGENITCSHITENGRVQEKLSVDILNDVFCQNIDDMYRLAYEVIKVNYAGFFEKLFNGQSGKLKETILKLISTNTEISTEAVSQNLS